MKITNEILDDVNWRTYLKRNRALLFVGLLLVLFGVWLNIQWFSERPSLNLYLINLLPGTLLIFTWYLASKHQNKRWSYIGVGILLALIVSFFSIFTNLAAGAFLAAMTPNTDVSHYYEISDQLDDSEITRHFPTSIPENATDIKFESLPKFLQGGGHIQLRFNLPQSEIEELLIEYRANAKYTFIGGDRSNHSNEDGGVPTTYFYTSETDDFSFSDNYEILVLNAEPGGPPEFPWNHGYSYGVVISLEESEIIYWAEYW